MKISQPMAAPGATRADWAFDLTLTALAITLALVPYLILMWVFGPYYGRPSVSAAAISGILMFLPITLRRHYPTLMMWLCTAAALLQVVVVPIPVVSALAVPLTAYTVARLVPGRQARTVVVLGVIGSVLGALRWAVLPFAGSVAGSVLAGVLTFLVCVGLVVTPYAIGRRALDSAEARQQQLDAAAERYRILLSEREHETLAAAAQARNQIARELHDIVAHSLSVMVVQAEGGRALAARHPEAAGPVLTTIAETGRQALGEMRRIVGVLRQGPEEATYAPTPGLSDVPAMVANTGAQLRIVGEPETVSGTLGLTVYRVVQEGLTNVIKHAGPGASATVTIEHRAGEIIVRLIDDGLGRDAIDDGHGHGLVGMSERVAAHGGRVTAGPRPDGGFEVTAVLPTAVSDEAEEER